jgi:hypothetical protein
MQVPHAEPGKLCPLHRQDVSEVCHNCPWFTRIIGKNPQNEEMVDNWHCAVAVLPMLLVENAQVGRQTGAALETMRNDVVASATEMVSTAITLSHTQRLIGRH